MLLPYLLQNGTVNDAGQVNELLLTLDAILDGGVTTSNLADDFTLDAQTQLSNNKAEVIINLRMTVTAALTAVIRDACALVSGAYTLTHAYMTYSLAGGGAPTGTVTFTVKRGSYIANVF